MSTQYIVTYLSDTYELECNIHLSLTPGEQQHINQLLDCINYPPRDKYTVKVDTTVSPPKMILYVSGILKTIPIPLLGVNPVLNAFMNISRYEFLPYTKRRGKAPDPKYAPIDRDFFDKLKIPIKVTHVATFDSAESNLLYNYGTQSGRRSYYNLYLFQKQTCIAHVKIIDHNWTF